MKTPNARTQFKDLFGKEYDFYGTSQLRFKLDDKVWKAKIPDDVDAIEVVEAVREGAFFPEPLARVRVELHADNDFNRWELVDINGGHCWLRFGLDDRPTPGRWRFDFFFVQ